MNTKVHKPVLRFLGATATVTGSKFLLEARGRRILIDCGLFQGYKQLRERNWKPLPTNPGDIDAVVLTHAHIDMLSVHADADEIMGWLAGMEEPPVQVFVVHGEAEASDTLRHRIEETLGWSACVAEYPQPYELQSR